MRRMFGGRFTRHFSPGVLVLIFATSATVPIAAAQSADTFALTSDMTSGRSQHSATLLADGQVLIAGGSSQRSLGQAISLR